MTDYSAVEQIPQRTNESLQSRQQTIAGRPMAAQDNERSAACVHQLTQFTYNLHARCARVQLEAGFDLR